MASTAAEIQSMIDSIDDGIVDIITKGQSFSINGRSYTRASIGELRALRSDMERAVMRKSTTKVRRTVAEM